jgi:hypothetical protein
MMKNWLVAAAVATLSGVGAAHATMIDFTTFAQDTPISSLDGITFSTYGGPGTAGTPLIGLLGFPPGGLVNSTTPSSVAFNNYPTSEFLQFSFGSPVSGVSFLFNNQGDNGVSSVTAYDSMGNVLENVGLGFTSPGDVVLSASGISKLVFDNGSGGGSNWVFDVSTVTFSSVPEPSTWAMMGLGFVALGFAGYRARRPRTAIA